MKVDEKIVGLKCVHLSVGIHHYDLNMTQEIVEPWDYMENYGGLWHSN